MSDFSLHDLFGPNPTRPNHQDFWKLSEIILDLDSAMEDGVAQGRSVDDVIAEKASQVGDPYSICYAAVQRAMRSHQISTTGALKARLDDVARTALVYMEGVIVGARLTQERDHA